MENTPKHCEECGRELLGRADKRFCSDSCRSAFNNKAASSSSQLIRNINRRLKVNRSILERLNPKGKVKVHRDKLVKAGFDFEYHTHTYKTREAKEYRFCYEHGYLELDGGYVLLVRRENEEFGPGGLKNR